MPDNKLWKYLDVIKFLTLVNGELYFARADKFKDKYEGAIPKQNYLQFAEMYRRAKLNQKDINQSGTNIDMKYTRKGLPKGIEKDIRKEFFRKFNERKKKVAISCWHLNESESAAMWEVYSRAGQGIAICTTLEKLHKIKKPHGYEMEMFKVDYIDFDKTYDAGFTDYELLPFKNKRKEFEYEHEFRIMLYQKNKEYTREESKSESELESYFNSETDSKSESESITASEPESKAGSESKSELKSKSEWGSNIEPVLNLEAGSVHESEADCRNRAGTELLSVNNASFVKSKEREPREFISELNYLPEEGIRIAINTSELIDEIIASPEMKKYEVAEIQKILDLINKLKGTNFKIKRSRLYENLHY